MTTDHRAADSSRVIALAPGWREVIGTRESSKAVRLPLTHTTVDIGTSSRVGEPQQGASVLRLERRYDRVRMISPYRPVNPIDVGTATREVLAWVDAAELDPVPEEWVPGATEVERRSLAALGSAVGSHWQVVGNAPAWTRNHTDIGRWIERGLRVPVEVASAIGVVASGGPDAVARLYDSVVDASARRHLGTFFTPSAEAEWMICRWKSLFGSPDIAIDVGAGVGVFTRLAHQHWNSARLTPIDVNPITLGLIGLLSSASFDEQLSPVLDDFAAWSQREFSSLRGARLILGNPPYTRLQLIPPGQRKALLAAAGGLCGSRSSLSALMLGTALALLGSADGICLLLPAQWLESDYAKALRNHLWTARNRRVELHLFNSQLFPDAQVDAVSLLVGPAEEREQPFVLGAAGSTSDGTVGSTEWQIPRNGDVPRNWRKLFSDEPPAASSGSPLTTYATIRRGAATGANSFFTLSEDEADLWALPQRTLRPYVQRARDFADVVSIDDVNALPPHSKRYMLVLERSDLSEAEVRRYLRHGVRTHVHQRRLARNRSVWFSVGAEAHPPDVIVSSSARTGFKLLNNRARAVIANNLYGLRWHETTPAQTRESILQWLRSADGQAAMLCAARYQADGLRKMEISELGRVAVPDEVTGRRTLGSMPLPHDPSLPSPAPSVLA